MSSTRSRNVVAASACLILMLSESPCFGQQVDRFTELDGEFEQSILGIFQSHCLECHSAKEVDGDLDLEQFARFADVRRDPAVIEKIVEMILSEEMPPEGSRQLSVEQRRQLLTWSTSYLNAEALANAGDPGEAVLRRLNNAEYTYTIQDLTKVDLDPTHDFPIDGAAGEGFTNSGVSLSMSPALFQKYLDAAKSVAAHMVLLPDGIRFSNSTHRPDWEDEILFEIWKIYARHTSGATDASLLDRWNQDAMKSTANDGRVDLVPYLTLLIEYREQLTGQAGEGTRRLLEEAARRNLSPMYVQKLAAMLLEENQPSLIFDEIRRRYLSAAPTDAGSIAEEISRWQDRLWGFRPIGHLGLVQSWQFPKSPIIESGTFRVPLNHADDDPAVIFLSSFSLGELQSTGWIEWRGARIERPGRPPISLRDLPAAAKQLPKFRAELRERVAEYLGAADAIRRAEGDVVVTRIARQRDVDPLLLNALLDYLGIENSNPVMIPHRFTQLAHNTAGYEFVTSWVEPDASALSLVSNSSDETVHIPGRLGPRQVAVHPRPERWVAAGWLSPVSGSVNIAPHVADAHDNCGNGIAWRVELRRGSQRRILAAGAVDLGGRANIASINDLAIQSGDLISLVIDARDRSHVCDLTEIELSITETEGEQREWSLSKDCADDVAAGNPHEDRFGNPGIWHFYWGYVDGQPTDVTIPPNSLLANWLDARTSDQASAIAERLGSLLIGRAHPAVNSADRDVMESLTALDGDVLSRVDLKALSERFAESNETEYGIDLKRFGQGREDVPIPATAFVTDTNEVLQLVLPASFCRDAEFVVTGMSRNGAAQLGISAEKPEVSALNSARPIVAQDGNAELEFLDRSFDAFRDLFPAAMCHARIVPVDEVVTLLLFHREDMHLQRLMLSEQEIDRLNQLWEELHFVSKDALRIETALEQILEFATQDADPRRFDPVLAPIAEGANRFRKQLVESESKHLEALTEFANSAFRRPLTMEEQARIGSFYEQLRESNIPHDEAMRTTLVRVLTSPTFLFRLEHRQSASELADQTAHLVTSHELASRLSYFLWSSTPDETLLRNARRGALLDEAVLQEETRRMLRNAKVRRLAIEFGCQWLHLRDFDLHDEKSETLFPEFVELRESMYEEAVIFFTDFFQNDRSILSLIDADHVFVNPELAAHYQIPTTAQAWQRIDNAREYGRGGVLALAATLSRQSGASRTSPILRGTWVSETLLGERLPKPPPNVPQLRDDERATETLSVRELISRHSADPACVKCHQKIDPYGFSLEHYDAIGRLRSRDTEGRVIETDARLPDGFELDGIESLRKYLLTERREDFVRQFCKKLLGYSLGRGVQLSDKPLLDQMIQDLERRDYRVFVAMEAIVSSKQFRMIRSRE